MHINIGIIRLLFNTDKKTISICASSFNLFLRGKQNKKIKNICTLGEHNSTGILIAPGVKRLPATVAILLHKINIVELAVNLEQNTINTPPFYCDLYYFIKEKYR